MIKEFKEFISKGNVLDLAIGLIMATYFGAIVKSMVDDILMPLIGQLLNGIDFTTLSYVITPAKYNSAYELIAPEVAIRYGAFLNTIVTFILVSLSVFLVVKTYNRMKRKKVEETTPTPPAFTKDQELLVEIRDLLKDKKN